MNNSEIQFTYACGLHAQFALVANCFFAPLMLKERFRKVCEGTDARGEMLMSRIFYTRGTSLE